MHNFYIKELREPNYQVVQQPQQGLGFNRSYLPNGKAVLVNSLEQQMGVIEKLKLTDWKRKPILYDVILQGEQYHLIQNSDGELQVQSNVFHN